jgi:hypothetical protein
MNTHYLCLPTGEGNAMNININVKHKFKINGKEYNSIEEMPDDIRKTFKKTMDLQTGSGREINPTTMRTKIIFNGIEYDSIEAMPLDVRELYEEVLKAAETGVAPKIHITGEISGSLIKHQSSGTVRSGDNRKPAKTEPSFSPRALIVSIMLIALILLFYYLLRGR